MNNNNWHAKTKEEVLKELNSSEQGLSDNEAKKRLHSHGPNQLHEVKKKSYFLMFLNQFRSPLVYLLIFAAMITYFLGHNIDTIVIVLVVMINSLVGWLQEVKAEKSMEAIKQLVALKSIVLRNDKEQEIDSSQIVPADMVILSEGVKVPADLRLLEVDNLKIDESILTGESIAVRKLIKILPEKTMLADRTNMAYSSTVVTSGKGLGIVVVTGQKTEIGKIAKEISQTEEEITPLNRKINQFSKYLLYIIVAICTLIFFLGIARGEGILDMFLTSVAAAISAIPEGLPAIITIILAIGVHEMAKRKAIVRRMQAVETLGAITTIASDKTGTLTLNQMFMEKVYLPNEEILISGKGYEPKGDFLLKNKKIDPLKNHNFAILLKTGVLCNDAILISKNGSWKIQGDPTEGALIVAAAKAKIAEQDLDHEYPQIDEIPFSSDNQFMATLHKHKLGKFLAVKGTIEKILNMSTHYLSDKKEVKLSQKNKERILSESHKEASNAYRILALAYQPIYKGEKIDQQKLNNLLYLGFVCLEDPPKQDALEAIKKCQLSGIRPIIITGDHQLTALAIAKKLGIAKDEKDLISEEEMENLSAKEFKEKIKNISVFARITPKMKLNIVTSLQAQGQIVGVTGDGVNDAPILKKADVGIAMGVGGTDVAREASDIILLNNNFGTIVSAIEEGRKIFLNIRRVIYFLFSTNAGELFVLVTALLAKIPLPLSAVQILWINLVTDTAGSIGLALEPKHKEIHEAKPRPLKEEIINHISLVRMIIVAILTTIGTMALYKLVLNSGASIEKARSVAFVTLSLFQIFNILNAQSMITSCFKVNIFKNKYIIWAILISLTLTIITTQVAFFRNLFDTQSLSLMDWAKSILVSSSIFIAVEIDKAIRKQ